MLIYDVGMHNGDDTHYYLTKGATVVGIEANPVAVDRLRERFAAEIKRGQLHLIGQGVGYSEGTLPFYIAPGDAPGSSFVHRSGYREVEVPVVKLSSIIREFGKPHFIKIDVEHVDLDVLRDLLNEGIVPHHLSVEIHKFEILLFLYKMQYARFRLVNCRFVSSTYKNHPISTPNGQHTYEFQHHSSGPFGQDLPMPWLKIEQVAAQWFVREALFGAGWFDVHAAMRGKPR